MVDLSGFSFEDWVCFGFFWVMSVLVFLQFFTRYVMNDSAAWTEEIARYLLICTVFIAISASVYTNRHIHVDLFYRLLPAPVCRVMSTLVDVMRFVFFVIAVGLTIQMMLRMGSLKMTIVDLPMNLVYGVCAFGFACAAHLAPPAPSTRRRRSMEIASCRERPTRSTGGAPRRSRPGLP